MWIKVCGVRDCETALRLAEMRIDAIGLNFYSGSPRRVAIDEAIDISKRLPERIDRVGVFVNHTVDEVDSIVHCCNLTTVQLHGDEPAPFLIELSRRAPTVRLIRAWRMGDDGLNGLAAFLDECRRESCTVAGCLIDANVKGVYGGSGTTVAWDRLAKEYRLDQWPSLILAGGLTTSNIVQAINVTLPWGVDVASGVESSPGVKNFDLVEEFIANARGTQAS